MICVRLVPPASAPKASSRQTERFNEQTVHGTFLVWTQTGKKFGVTHQLCEFCSFHTGDVVVNFSAAVSTNIFLHKWVAVFGPTSCQVDMGAESQGRFLETFQLLGIRRGAPEGPGRAVAPFPLGVRARQVGVLLQADRLPPPPRESVLGPMSSWPAGRTRRSGSDRRGGSTRPRRRTAGKRPRTSSLALQSVRRVREDLQAELTGHRRPFLDDMTT